MSGNFENSAPDGSPNPFGQSPYGAPNPYASPSFAGGPGQPPPVKGKVIAPAIGLLILAVIGIIASTANVALSFRQPKIDPNQPPFVQEMMKGSAGLAATVVQGLFILVNAFIIVGSVQMMRLKMRPLAIAAASVAMVNFGSCCCLLGMPIGIWSIVILLQDDVKQA